MDNNTVNSVYRGKIAPVLLILANIILVVMVWQARARRLASLPGDIPFITGNFALVLGVVMAAILVTITVIFPTGLRRYITPVMAWTWIIITIVGIALATTVSDLIAVYISGFFVWVILVDIALLLVAYRASLAEVKPDDVVRQIIPVVFGILLTFMMLEGLLRVYFSVSGTEADRVAYVYSVEKILEIGNRYEGQPYTNYGLSAAHPEHNNRGYRGDQLESPKSDATYRIFALGGSTTYGEGITPDESYPAQLEQILHDDYGYTHIEVINAGVNAYSSFDSLANLTYHVLDDAPDMIIVYHGVNDVRARLVEPDLYTGQNLQRGYWNPIALQRSLNPSVLLRFITIQLGIIESPTQFETILGADGGVPRCGFFEDICTQLDNQPATDILNENPPVYFERNLRNMVAIANAHDIAIMFSTWHYYADETDLPNPMMLDHMQAAVIEQNNLIRLAGNDMNVPIIDFAQPDMLASASFWQDGMHMTPAGTRLQAKFYADFLIENDLLPSPENN